ncbi:alpha/beta hydrolase [Cryobacterium sp. MLB-32]|uniref:alpha/beta hydrolase n=1 Tax=Cryobacterium sp. MLB-32 TaxID=1529318 RepID=UPI000689415C|nr:alpha/beta hydrolase fold domain-containing protein [Cryobacterium sp. MLB-32]
MTPAQKTRNVVRWTEIRIPADDGHRIPLRIYQTQDEPRATLVWAHGGSWSHGSLHGWHAACVSVASLAGIRLVNVGYRQAPGWTHPTALHDVLAAIRWSLSLHDDPGAPLCIGGDSAGGTLAGSAALWCRDNDVPLSGQILAYPPLDPDCQAPSYFNQPPGFPERNELRRSWASYRGMSGPLADERYLTPRDTQDLSGLCPAALLTGAGDPVSDDVRTYAGRLRLASVPTTLRVDPDIGHGDFLRQDGAVPNPVHTWITSTLDSWFGRTIPNIDPEDTP